MPRVDVVGQETAPSPSSPLPSPLPTTDFLRKMSDGIATTVTAPPGGSSHASSVSTYENLDAGSTGKPGSSGIGLGGGGGKGGTRISTVSSESRVSRISYFSTGRDFYDDGYSEGGSDVASVEDRLDFSNIQVLKGRETKLQVLHDVYSHVQRKGVKTSRPRVFEDSCVAMIRGVSGTGKSTLVKQFIEDLEAQSKVIGGPTKPHFISGKYDDLSGGDPFSAIFEAFSGFALNLVEMEDEKTELERIRNEIQKALGEEAQILATAIPNLRPVLFKAADREHNDTAAATAVAAAGTTENAWNRLRYIFQVFANAISTAQRPVVMFLDDLQWCDSASLELIQSLLTDVDLKYFMFIGAYRSDEVQKGDELLSRLEVIGMMQRVAEIELVNLSLEELMEFVTHVLKKSGGDEECDDEEDPNDEAKDDKEENDEAKVLVEVLHRKTSGNIFFAMQILEELQRKGILIFSRMTFEWECNLDNVNLDELMSDDVIATVTSKIATAPELLQRALIIAAYTRSTVDIGTLQKLMELDGHSVSMKELEKLLDKAVVDGLLSNSMGSKSYSFSHDRIQQASYEMMPFGPIRDEFRLQMGRRLYEMGKSELKGEDWMLFAAAEHFNATATQVQLQEDDPLFLTKMNLQVGERAVAIAAFEIASKLLGFGMRSLLQSAKDPWENHYDITLQLYQGIAAVQFCQGHYEMGKGIGNRIFEHARTPEDKLPTQIALAKALGKEREHRDAFELCAAALRELGAFPKGPLSMNLRLVKDMIYVKNYLKKHSNEDILSLPIMEDTRNATIVELQALCGFQAYMCGKQVEFLVAALKQLRMTFKYGICPHSVNAIMSYCLVCDTMNDMTSVHRLIDIARQMLDISVAKEVETLQLFISTYYISSWKDPHNDILSIYHRAGKAGMESGDFETGLLNIMASYYYEFLAGVPLSQLDIKYNNVQGKMKMYRIQSMEVLAIQQLLLIQHLRGSAKSPLDFVELEQFGFTTTDGSENYKVLYGYMTRVQLGVYFGNCPFSEKIMELMSQTNFMDTSYAVKNVQLFFGALTYATLARENKKKSYLKKAKSFTQELKMLCKIKGDKCWNRYLLAETHCRASGGKTGVSIQSSYDDAITAALQSGHSQDAALGAQLAAEYFLSMKTLHTPALAEARDSLIQHFLTQARDLYHEWGARGMVKHLEKKYNRYLTSITSTDDDRSSAVVSADLRTINSLDQGFDVDSFPSLPKMIASIREEEKPKDDFSVLTDTDRSAWGRAGEFSNPHTQEGNFPVVESVL